MRTDPRKACANEDERFGWAVVHDLVCHPLMALSGFSRWSLRFHDWTSHKAWPRVVAPAGVPLTLYTPFGPCKVTQSAPGLWHIKHPKVNHTVTCGGGDAVEALETAVQWFQTLADQHANDQRFQKEFL